MQGTLRIGFGLAVLALALACACERVKPAEKVDLGLIAVGDKTTIRTDTVGVGAAERPATFVLVDAENHDDRDAVVTLGGILVDADGHQVGKLRPESLRIPARHRRAFALVDDHQQARATATAAHIDVRGAIRPRFPEPVSITQGHAWDDHGQVVVTAMATNTTDRPCIAVVLAAFHGDGGVPLTRPFAIFEMGPHSEWPTRFVGPPGAKEGYIFMGDVTFQVASTARSLEHLSP